MNLLKLSFSYLRRKSLNTSLNILLLSFGVATMLILLLFSTRFEDNLYKNANGIDLVVGAKGSPIQLILSSIYHIDSPTGNISIHEAREILQNRMVETAIPLALGDNVEGFRIVGTTTGYLEMYGAELAQGTLWDYEFEVVVGADIASELGIELGSELVTSHGLSQGGHSHEDHPLRVVGKLYRTGTVLDRLILTPVETMWGIHEHDAGIAMSEEESHENHIHGEESHLYDEGNHVHDEDNHVHSEEENEVHQGHLHEYGRPVNNQSYLEPENSGEEITSLLIGYSNPLAAAQLPRFVNESTSMQAAAPAFEITRLMNLLGVGFDTIQFFAFILILASVLGIFIALLNSMKERRYDLAIMRSLGGSRFKLFSMVLLEGVLIALAGGFIGLLLGHGAMAVITSMFEEARQFAISGSIFIFEELLLLGFILLVGITAAVLPAIQAYRTDIAETLSKS